LLSQPQYILPALKYQRRRQPPAIRRDLDIQRNEFNHFIQQTRLNNLPQGDHLKVQHKVGLVKEILMELFLGFVLEVLLVGGGFG
jgi:hypothetical protein